jgi:hypothetical protein
MLIKETNVTGRVEYIDSTAKLGAMKSHMLHGTCDMR